MTVITASFAIMMASIFIKATSMLYNDTSALRALSADADAPQRIQETRMAELSSFFIFTPLVQFDWTNTLSSSVVLNNTLIHYKVC